MKAPYEKGAGFSAYDIYTMVNHWNPVRAAPR